MLFWVHSRVPEIKIPSEKKATSLLERKLLGIWSHTVSRGGVSFSKFNSFVPQSGQSSGYYHWLEAVWSKY